MYFAFGDFVLDTDNKELGQRGVPVPLEPKAYEVLEYLVLNREHLISKQDLLSHIWSDVYVDDSAVSRYIHALREALGDSLDVPWAIQTRRGRGYRFIAEVTESKAPPEIVHPRMTSAASPASYPEDSVAPLAETPRLPPAMPGLMCVCFVCRTTNADEAKFCRTCGAALRMMCPQCEQRAIVPAAYCQGCGERFNLAGPGHHAHPLRAHDNASTGGGIAEGIIQCAICSNPNPRGTRFCRACGANLNAACPRCEKRAVVPAVHCPTCGYRLS